MPHTPVPAPTPRTRRGFLRDSGSALGAAWLAANGAVMAATARAAAEARERGGAFAHLSAAEAADLEAIAARIVPSGDTPGAREAGVIWFIDQALGGFMAGAAAELRAGLAELNAQVHAPAGKAGFATLDAAAQDELLRAHETTPFFETVRFLTLAGLLTLPSYGGNQDYTGWTLIGFEHRHVWSAPFGYYDAEALREADHHG